MNQYLRVEKIADIYMVDCPGCYPVPYLIWVEWFAWYPR